MCGKRGIRGIESGGTSVVTVQNKRVHIETDSLNMCNIRDCFTSFTTTLLSRITITGKRGDS